ncbi:T9SS type A sorting domain-containing protein [Coprobacter sp.]
MKKIVSLFILVCVASLVNATVYYVKPNAESTAWKDKNAEQVYTDIKSAYAAAGVGDQVWIAAGTYTIKNEELDGSKVYLTMKAGTSLYGGFAGTENILEDRVKVDGGQAWDFVNQTIVSIDAAATASNITNQKTKFTTETIIDGITFEKSKGSAVTVRNGGVVQNCIFRENVSTWGGGGVQMYMGGKVQYCYFFNNSSAANDKNGGAGLYCSSTLLEDVNYVDHCVFDSNRGLKWGNICGGGLRAAAAGMVTNCIFYNNTAGSATDGYGKGSAIVANWASNTFVNCLVYNNTGYPIYTDRGAIFINMTICNNLTGDKNSYSVFFDADGGGTLANSVVWNNMTTADSKAYMYTKAGSTVSYFDCVASNRGAGDIKTAAENPDWSFYPLYQISDDNTGEGTDVNYAKFVKPTSFVGAVSLTEAEALAEIRNADWKMDGTSFLINKGNSYYDALVEYDSDLSGKKRAMTEEDPIDLGVYEVDPITDGIIPVQTVTDGKEIYASSGILYINAKNSNVEVFDIAGKCVKSFRTGDFIKSVVLNKGSYVVKVERKGHLITKKIIL